MRKKCKGTELSVFRGREAKLNRAIFQILSSKEQLTIYDIYKELKQQKLKKTLRYSSVNKRVRALEQSGYLVTFSVRRTKAGFNAVLYCLAKKACLAIVLGSISFDNFIDQVDDQSAEVLLAVIIDYRKK